MSIVDRYAEPLQAELDKRVKAAGLKDLSRENLAKTLLIERDSARSCGESKRTTSSACTSRPACGRVRRKASAPLTEELRKLEPSGESTRLGAAIGAVLDDLRGTVPAGIILLTDGVNTEGPGLDEAAAAARRRGVPLLLVGLGDEKPVRDLKLADLLVDEVVFVDDVVYFEAKLTGSGYEGREVRVTLRQRDKPEVLAETKVKVGPDGQSQTVRLPYRPTEVGEFRYVVEVEPLEGELQTDNNRLERTVRVRKEQIRVLLVQGLPELRVPLPAKHARAGTTRSGWTRSCRTPTRTMPSRTPRRCGCFPCGARKCSPTTSSSSATSTPSCSASRRCRTWRSSSTSRARAGRWCFWPGRGSCRWPSATRPWRGSCRSNWAASVCRRPIGRSPRGSSSSRPSWAWPARRCNSATRRPKPSRSGSTCRRFTG